MALVETDAVLLRAHAFGDSSRILRFYTRDAGLVSAMAKGAAKTMGRGGTNLSSFATGRLTVYMKQTRDLQTLKEFAATRPRGDLGHAPLRLAGASVVAELVLRHAESEANPPLFEALERALDRIGGAATERVFPVVLSEAWRMVAALGYRPELGGCVRCGRALPDDAMGRFHFGDGGVLCAACGSGADGPRVGPGARRQLAALLAGDPPVEVTRPRANLRLLSDFVTYHVSDSRPFGSLSVLAGLVPR